MAGIYVHVPYCHAKCAYCDFYSLANVRTISSYAAAVSSEWQARRHELGAESVRTIYFGGGTPSILPDTDFAAIAALFPKADVEEFTIEVNPEDVSAERVAHWRHSGVNRVSMGVQSLADSELQAVGRRHTAADTLAAIDILKQGGIDNISADLIYGLPGQTLDSWQHSVDTLLYTGITHLSAYCLSYEEGTRLYKQRRRGDITEASDELIEQMYGYLCLAATAAGFEHYEISNFALPGYASRHNSAYWNLTSYLGLGPGAHSLDAAGVRRIVPPSIKDYLADPAGAAIIDSETAPERVNDLIFISLRTARGLDLDLLAEPHRSAVEHAATPFISRGLLLKKGSVIVIPEHHYLIADSIIRELLVE